VLREALGAACRPRDRDMIAAALSAIGG
jgi:hypothetical protein